MKKIVLALVLIVILAGAYFMLNKDKQAEIKTDPLIIIRAISYKDMIRIDLPSNTDGKVNNKISSPLQIGGSARGNWYFEASFPVQVLDENGVVLGTGIAQAEGEWMTTEYVPFSGQIVFSKPKGKTGTLVFRKDNPSGLPEHDDSLPIPIVFE